MLADQTEYLVLMFSGPVGSGKTSLSSWLVLNSQFSQLSTSKLIQDIFPDVEVTRKSLQCAGNYLDRTTNFSWIASAVRDRVKNQKKGFLIVDAVRKPQQVLVMRSKLNVRIVHCHLYAPPKILRDRHLARNRREDDGLTHDEIQADESESFQSEMNLIANLRFESKDGKIDVLGKKLLAML